MDAKVAELVKKRVTAEYELGQNDMQLVVLKWLSNNVSEISYDVMKSLMQTMSDERARCFR